MSRQPDSDSGSADDHGVKIAMRHVAQDGGNKPWLPATLTKMDKTFCKCSKFDRGFVMFCLSKSMQTSSKKGDCISCNVPVFQHLLDERRRVSIECAQEALEVEELDPNDSAFQKKKKIKSSHEALVNPVISITFPAVGDFDERTVDVLWGVRSADLWVELTGANMKHLKQLVKSQADQVLCKKKASPKKSPKKRLRRMQNIWMPCATLYLHHSVTHSQILLQLSLRPLKLCCMWTEFMVCTV